MKQMEKLETIEIAHSLHSVNIRMPRVEKKAGIALQCQDLAIGYPEKMVAEKIYFVQVVASSILSTSGTE